MSKYRKKPILIEAEVYKWGLEDGFEKFDIEESALAKLWYDFSVTLGGFGKFDYRVKDKTLVSIPYINTLEGRHYISPNDYIITGIKGERYPCKKDIFEATYEVVESGDSNE